MPQTILSLTELTCLIIYQMEPVQSLTVLCMKIGQLCLQVQVEKRLNYWIIPSKILGKKVSMSLGSLTLCIDKLYRKITQCSAFKSFLIFVWNRSGFLFFLLVSDMPTSSHYSGAVALPTLTGDGVIVQYYQYFYQLNCNASSCDWEILVKELSLPVRFAVAMNLPAEYTCE